MFTSLYPILSVQLTVRDVPDLFFGPDLAGMRIYLVLVSRFRATVVSQLYFQDEVTHSAAIAIRSVWRYHWSAGKETVGKCI